MENPEKMLFCKSGYGSETHANILLDSLRYLLSRGPINEDNKRYDMKFGGDMSLQLNENTTITVPNHAFDWIHTIDNIKLLSNPAKLDSLSQLIVEFPPYLLL